MRRHRLLRRSAFAIVYARVSESLPSRSVELFCLSGPDVPVFDGSLSMTAHLVDAKRIAMSLLTFGALASATVVTAAPAQAAEPLPAARSVSEHLDIGAPGEGDVNAGTPAVAPDGTLVWSTPTTPLTRPLSSATATAQGWIAVTAIAGGARIRSRPVNGPVLGTIPYGAGFWVSCKRGASDGHAWGWSYRGGTYGWVRGDLWEVEQHTGPGGGGTPQVPWCP
jgi:hypothetical protein